MDDSLARRLRSCRALPTLPVVAMRIVELANHPGSTLVQIADQIALDPALTAKVLQAAHSALYRGQGTPGNLRQALTLMGTHAALAVALSFSVAAHFAGSPASASLMPVWRRSVLAALASRFLASKIGSTSGDELFLASILQDIGVLALAAACPGEYEEVLASANDHDELVEAERAAFGSGHDEVGHWLLSRWNLPRRLCLAVFASHDPNSAWEARTLASVAALCGQLADLCLNGASPQRVARVAHGAREHLGFDAGTLSSLLADLRAALPEMECLFEIPLTQADALALLDEAQRLLTLHSEADERTDPDAPQS